MDPASIDQIQINFNPENLLAINAVIGLMMLGVSIDLKVSDFRLVLRSSRAMGVGLAAQLILLPLFTYLLTLVIRPHASIALGVILIVSCSGSNLTNILSYLANGNAALSICMTAASTAATLVMTPFNLSLWGSLQPAAAPFLRQINLSPLDVLMSIFMIVGVPLILGLTLSRIFPTLPDLIRRPFRIFSMAAFLGFAVMGLKANWEPFFAGFGALGPVVFLSSFLCFGLGYVSSLVFKLSNADRRSVFMEVGMQNPALALIIVFAFFEGAGGTAAVAAFWGVWQIIFGLILALLLSARPSGK